MHFKCFERVQGGSLLCHFHVVFAQHGRETLQALGIRVSMILLFLVQSKDTLDVIAAAHTLVLGSVVVITAYFHSPRKAFLAEREFRILSNGLQGAGCIIDITLFNLRQIKVKDDGGIFTKRNVLPRRAHLVCVNVCLSIDCFELMVLLFVRGVNFSNHDPSRSCFVQSWLRTSKINRWSIVLNPGSPACNRHHRRRWPSSFRDDDKRFC